MKSIIEDLWYGNITSCEDCGVRDVELEALAKKMVEKEESLRKILTGEERAAFRQYVARSDDYACVFAARAFRDGFCLAGKLLCEVLIQR